MATVPSASHAAFSSVARRSYIATETYNDVFFSYAVTFSNNVYAGVFSAVTGATAANCPQGRILHETGKKLYPSANPGVAQYMVSVFDPVSMLTGFINPNNPTFSLMNTDRPAYIADSPSGTGTGITASARANALYTRGDVLAGGRFDLSGNAMIYGNLANVRGPLVTIADGVSMAVTATQLVTNGILRATLTTARNITLPDAADVLALIGTAVGTTVRFTYINLAATNVATFVAGANTTSVGALTVAGSSSASFLIFVASATTITIIRA
jgi:hypothetical protein